MQHPPLGGAGALARRLSRRTLLKTSAAGVAASTLLGDDVTTLLDDAPPAAVRDVTLTASEFDWELAPGLTVRAWGYDGRVPGPEIRVREGDLLRVRLRNELPVATTIHWHGVVLPPAMDGPAGLSQAPVAPGEEFLYEFVAQPAGTRWYHSHTDPAVQGPIGLHGPLVIEPRSPGAAYDREYTLVLGEWDLELTPAVAAGLEPRGPRDQALRGGELGADLFLLNGRLHGADGPLRIAEGERILLRLINAGHLVHPFHTHGHSFTLVATDGNPVPEAARLVKDTVLIGPGERYDLELLGDNPGVWMVHCHVEHHMANGMMTLLAYDGATPTGPAADLSHGTHGGPAPHGDAHAHAGHDPAAADPAAHDHDDSAVAAAPPADAVEIAVLDDRFEPAALSVLAGATVTWVNHGANRHSVAAYDGSFESPVLAPGERFAVTLPAPGERRYLCRQHAMQGMLATVTVEPAPA